MSFLSHLHARILHLSTFRLLIGQVGVPATVALVHHLQVLVRQSARVAEQLVRRRHVARLLAFTQPRHNRRPLAVRQLTVVVPPVHVAADPSLRPAVHTVEDVDLAVAFLAAQFADGAFARVRGMVLFHRAELRVAFPFVARVTEYRAWSAAVLRCSACSASCLFASSA